MERIGFASLRPLLLLQFLLLAGFLVLCVSAGPRIDPDATKAIVAGMLGVSAMAVQNALVQISLKGAPSTAVMTTNITRFMMDVGDVMLGREPADVAKARRPGDAHLAGDRRLRRWLRPGGGMRGGNRPLVPGVARRARAARGCDGAGCQSRGRTRVR